MCRHFNYKIRLAIKIKFNLIGNRYCLRACNFVIFLFQSTYGVCIAVTYTNVFYIFTFSICLNDQCEVSCEHVIHLILHLHTFK